MWEAPTSELASHYDTSCRKNNTEKHSIVIYYIDNLCMASFKKCGQCGCVTGMPSLNPSS